MVVVCWQGWGVQQTECSKCFLFFFVITNALYMKKRNNPKGLIYLFACLFFVTIKMLMNLT